MGVRCCARLPSGVRGGNGKFASQVKLQGAVLGRGYVEGGAVVVIARLPSEVELQGPVLGAGYVKVIDGCPVLCPAALPNESFPGLR